MHEVDAGHRLHGMLHAFVYHVMMDEAVLSRHASLAPMPVFALHYRTVLIPCQHWPVSYHTVWAKCRTWHNMHAHMHAVVNAHVHVTCHVCMHACLPIVIFGWVGLQACIQNSSQLPRYCSMHAYHVFSCGHLCKGGAPPTTSETMLPFGTYLRPCAH